MNWTEQQRAAIETEGSLIVSAAAGAGKTAVLTERLCRLVTAGTGVDRLLVLTFTRAAAAEMKNRIMRRLMSLSAEETEETQKKRLSDEAQAVTGANISTIHAFCARVIKRHSHALGLSPRMRIAGDMEIAALKEQVQAEVLDRLSGAEEPAWHTLLAAFGGEKKALETMLSCYAFLMSQPEPFDWLEKAVAAYREGDALLLQCVELCKRELSMAVEALTRAADTAPPDWEGVHAALDDDLSRARALLMMPDYAHYRAMLLDISFETLRFPRGTEEEDKRAFKEPREAYKALIRAERARLWREETEERACMRQAAEVLTALSFVLRAYDEAFIQKKRERELMDYNDLERLTLEALSHPAIAAEYREKFDYVAVDEYQDSNRVQEEILSRVSRRDNLFLVGDVKQSIYRFRQAEPALFIEKLSAAEQGELGRVDLLHNFRSGTAVIDGVNELFAALMKEESCGLAYDERARLVSGGLAGEGAIELHVIEKTAAEEDEDAHDAIVEARFVAARIRALMQENSSLRYADIAVLIRNATHAERFASALALSGVPSYAQSNGGYFDAIEVQMLLNLLRVVDNRRRDLPLIAVLRSSVGGLDETALAHIRARHPAGSFYEAAAACALEAEPPGAELAAFFARLDAWREDSRLLSVEAFIGKILDETGLYEEFAVLKGGKTRCANLDALLTKARAFEKSGARGLYAFLQHIELAGRGASFGSAQAASADVVRILTVHRSKGLEFPVVFLCQTGARFVLTGDREALVLHGARGAGLRFIDEKARLLRDTAARQTLLGEIRLEELAEEMRVLYVAMTRAKSRLILCGCLRNAADKCERPEGEPLAASILKGGTPLGWLLSCRGASLPLILHERGEWLIREESEAAPELPAEDESITRAVRARFAWRYPFSAAVDLPAKTSVTQLQSAESPAFEPPRFITGDAPGALSLGTAMHTAMQRLPQRALTDAEARAYIKSLQESGRIGGAEADKLDAGAIGWFSATPLYARLLKSPRAERELPFAYSADAAALFDTEAEESILLQGVIDACFIEDGQWVLLDYKTDAPRAEDDEAALALRHKKQIDLYALALAALTGIEVKERIVVYLRLQKLVRC